MIDITYTSGDATQPEDFRGENKIIAHLCNDRGFWGAGFTRALSRRYLDSEMQYRGWSQPGIVCQDEPVFALGATQFVPVKPGLIIANMVAQRGVNHRSFVRDRVDYEALRRCLRAIRVKAQQTVSSVHMPKIGCGLAGSSWDKISPLIIEELSCHNVGVLIYEYD